jgi:hypothetical protein
MARTRKGIAVAGRKKEEIITFKVDRPLWEAMQAIPNRSEFIRSAIQTALQSVCPLCQGTGTLTPDQRRHWGEFAEHHVVELCEDCHAVHLVCDVDGDVPEEHAHD